LRKNILISEELFVKLLKFFLLEDDAPKKEISEYLEQKLNQLVMHDLYSKYRQERRRMRGKKRLRRIWI